LVSHHQPDIASDKGVNRVFLPVVSNNGAPKTLLSDSSLGNADVGGKAAFCILCYLSLAVTIDNLATNW
jgi:hypothetical protein